MKEELYIVGVGASAGGLEALTELFSNLPSSLEKITSFIVAQHLSPTHRSMLVQILSKEAVFPVSEALDNQVIESGQIYITPPDSDIQVVNGRILLTKPKKSQGPKPSVDFFFSSLSLELKESAIGIILSGTGSDGAYGLQEIKSRGGIAIIQNPETAKYDGMPLSSLQTGIVDFSLPPEKIGLKLQELILNQGQEQEPEQSKIPESDIKEIFKILSKKFGVNFDNYKPSTILRRLDKGMRVLKLNSMHEYLDYLRENPEEVSLLYESFLIGVTSFFRDEKAFRALESSLEERLNRKEIGESFRVWVPGCSTGEEAYSIAMILQELFEKYNISSNLQIFATDIQDNSLQIARKGYYPLDSLKGIPKPYREKFINLSTKGFEIDKSIRSKILFSHHNLFLNPPFLKIDILSCRNLLIYLKPEIQRQLFPIFHYSLRDDGLLFLGKSESVTQVEDLFEIKDPKYKIFQKRKFANLHNIKFNTFQPLGLHSTITTKREVSNTQLLRNKILEAYNELSDYPYVILNPFMDIIETKGDLRDFMQIPQGVLNLNVSKLIRKELQIEVKNLIMKSMKLHKPIKTSLKRFILDGKRYFLRILVSPVFKDIKKEEEEIFILIFEKYDLDLELESLDSVKHERNDLTRVNELEQELSITREHLQTYIEEIETANEELQSLNEELQSSNEELQSSNEELETSNEELQSANEELHTAYSEIKHVNDELKKREDELKKFNLLFTGLFENTQQGHILLEENLTIRLINFKAQELCKQIGMEKIGIGKNLLEFLSEGMIKSFIPSIRILKETLKEVKTTSKFEFIKTYYYDICFFPILKPGIRELDFIGIGIIDVTESKTREIEIFSRDEILTSFLESKNLYLIRTDMQGCYSFVNDAFCEKFGYTRDQLIGKFYAPTVHPDDLTACESAIFKLLQNPDTVATSELRKPNPQGGFFDTEWEFVAIKDENGNIIEVQGVGRDLTHQKSIQKELLNQKNQLELVIWGGGLGTWDWDVINDTLQFNHRWSDMLGYDLEKVRLRYSTWLQIVHPEDREKVKSAIDSALIGTTGYYEIEHREKTAGGEWKWIVATGKVVERDVRGRPLRVIGIHQDITEKKEAEGKERAAEDRSQLIITTMQEGILIEDMTGTIISVNKSAEEIFGRNSADLIGKKSYEITWTAVREDGSIFQKEDHPVMHTILTGTSQKDEIIGIHRPGGERRWISVSTQLLHHPNTNLPYGVFVVFHDITNRKVMESELEKSKWLLGEMGKIAKVGGWEYDLASHKLIWTDEIFRIHDLEITEEPSVEDALNFYHEEDRETIVQAFEELLQDAKAYSIELRFLTRLGKQLWVRTQGYPILSEGRVVKAVGTFQDITEVVKNRFLLEENQNRLQSLMDALPVAVYTTDQNGHINYFNLKAEELWGRKAVLGHDQFCGAKKLYSKSGVLYTADTNPVAQALQEKTSILGQEAILERPTGERRNIIAHIVPFIDNEGNVTGAVNAIVDITERISSEKQLETQNSKLRALNKEQEQLTYITSHDLQEPVRTIASCIEIINSEYSGEFSSEPRKLINFIKDSSDRMSILVNGLLDYSRIGINKQIEEIDLNDLLSTIIDELNEEIQMSKARLIISPLPVIHGYPLELHILFKNLITNSLKFRKKEEHTKIEIWSKEEPESHTFHVQDNGIGIPEKDREKVFILFKRLHNRKDFKGTGIGLAHCKKIIELHRGSIWISENTSGGTTFSFQIPKKI